MKTKHISDSFYQMYNFTFLLLWRKGKVFTGIPRESRGGITWCVCQKNVW